MMLAPHIVMLFAAIAAATELADAGRCSSQEDALRGDVAASIRRARQSFAELIVDYSFPLTEYAHRGGYIYHSLCFVPGAGFAIDSAHGETGVASWDWTLRQKTIILPGGWLAVWPNKRTYAFHETEAPTVPEDVKEDPFFRACGLWPMRDLFGAGHAAGCSYDLEAVVLDERYTMAREGPKHIVLTRGKVDRIVLDAERGCSLVERTWCDEGHTDLMVARVTEVRRIGECLWLPATFSIERTRRRGSETGREVLLGRLVKTAPRGEAALRYDPPAGAALLDQRTSAISQTVAGGEDYLLAQAQGVRGLVTRGRTAAQRGPLVGKTWLVGLATFALSLALGWRLYSRTAT